MAMLENFALIKKKINSLIPSTYFVTDTKLKQYIIDFKKLDQFDVRADVVFCCLGTTIKKAGSQDNFRKVDFLYPKLLAKFSLGNLY